MRRPILLTLIWMFYCLRNCKLGSIRIVEYDITKNGHPVDERILVLRTGGASGFNTGNGEKLSNSQAGCLAGVAWVLLSFSPFPVLDPTQSPCRPI